MASGSNVNDEPAINGLEEGMIFDTYEEAEAYIENFFRENHHPVRKRNTKTIKQKINDDPNQPPEIKIVGRKWECKHFGQVRNRSTGKRPNQKSFALNCKFYVWLSYNKRLRKYWITALNLTHSHPVSPEVYHYYPSSRRPDSELKKTMEAMLVKGVKRDIVMAYAHAHGKYVSRQDVWNMDSKCKKKKIEDIDKIPIPEIKEVDPVELSLMECFGESIGLDAPVRVASEVEVNSNQTITLDRTSNISRTVIYVPKKSKVKLEVPKIPTAVVSPSSLSTMPMSSKNSNEREATSSTTQLDVQNVEVFRNETNSEQQRGSEACNNASEENLLEQNIITLPILNSIEQAESDTANAKAGVNWPVEDRHAADEISEGVNEMENARTNKSEITSLQECTAFEGTQLALLSSIAESQQRMADTLEGILKCLQSIGASLTKT